jgi:single-strand DNA-binding protein
MANLNKVILIGRLTRDPESRTFATGGKVTKFGFAVNNRKKNSQSGQWEDEPMFIDCEAFNRGEFGKLADRIEQYCKKGSQICIEGRLHLDQWDDKTTGQKRSKHKIVVDELHLLDGRPDGQGGQGGGAPRSAGAPARGASPAPAARGGDDYGDEPPANNGDEIPF